MKVIMNMNKWCADNFHYYVVFSKAILFVLGLVMSYKLVEYTVFSILVVLLSREWEEYEYDMPKASIIVNIQEGTYQVLQIIWVCVAHQYSGLFKMLVCSTTLHIIGLSLCFSSSVVVPNGPPNPGMFYTALVLLTLCQAAIKAALREFLEDQVTNKDPPITNEEEERAESRANFWWNSVSSLAAIVSLFGVPINASLEKLSVVSLIAMGVAFLWFLLGTTYYRRAAPPGCPLREILFVAYTAVARRWDDYPEQVAENPISPRVSWLRWLDKAAVVEEDEEQQPAPGNRLQQVRGVKFQLKMFPLWATFITFSLVSATGSTFFLEEAAIVNDKIPILFFVLLERFTRFIVAEVSDYVIQKCFEEKNNIVLKVMLVRMGTGMACCVLCCITAWANSKKARENPSDMSIFVLFPQFALLGFMGGFAQDGFESFFESQVSESTSRQYGAPLGEFVTGYGKFVSAVCIVVLRGYPFGWLQENVSSSQLDKYYLFLAILSSANLVFYGLVAYWYGDETFLSEDAEGLVQTNNNENFSPKLARTTYISSIFWWCISIFQ